MADDRRPTIAVDLRALVARPTTGIGWFTLSLLERLAARGAARYLGMAHAEPFAAERLRSGGVDIEVKSAPLGVLWQQLAVPRRLARGDIDLFWSPLLILPRRLPVPGVVTIHDLTPLLLPAAHRLKVRLSVVPFIRATVRDAAVIAVDSRATADDVQRLFPAAQGKLEVVYPGVDADFRPGDDHEIAAVREELGCPEGYLLFVGTLEPRKNVGLLLDVWERLRSRGDCPPLVLCGGPGWRSRALQRRIRELRSKGLVALGSVPRERLFRIYRGARVFVYPSFYEGFGLPPAEAMASGVPTLAANRASLPEVVGDAGLLFDPERPGELETALGRLLADPRHAADLAARGPARAARFKWERAAAEMEAIFARALAERSG